MSVKNFYYNGSKRFVLILSLTFFLFLLPLISAGTYLDCNIYGNCAPTVTSTTITFNNNTGNVNNSIYWNGYSFHNMSIPFFDWKASFLFNYNQSLSFFNWLSTFVYNYNQTQPAISYANANFYNKSANINAVDYNITANVYHGNIDWVYTIIGMSGNTACDNLDNKVAGYSYTCQTVIDTGGGTVACGTTLVALNAQSACKAD